MIRFVHVGSQIYEDKDQFLFCNTVTDRVFYFYGEGVFDSLVDFLDVCRGKHHYLVQCCGLIPKEFR